MHNLVVPAQDAYNPNVMRMSVVTSTAQARIAGRRRVRPVVRRRIGLAALCLLVVLLLPSNGYLGAARADFAVQQAIGARGFRLAAWEADAIRQKIHDQVTQPGAELSAREQHDLVITYFDAITRVADLNAEIERIYADPKESGPAAKAAPQQRELNALRAEQAGRRPAVERILERQVAQILR